MRNLTAGHTINITLMFFQLKLNESCAIVKKELKICVALVGGYYYMSQMLYAGQSDREDVTFFTDF